MFWFGRCSHDFKRSVCDEKVDMTIPFDDNWVNSAETRKQNRILLKSKQGGRR